MVRTAKSALPTPAGDPGRNCALCPRLAGFRADNREMAPDWHNAPVPSFGAVDASLLVVGLAPGLRGANRTGRPFTGDYAGDLLYATLKQFGFAKGDYAADPNDGLELVGARITNAVRCVPPQNKPLPVEMTNCRPFLAHVIAEMPRLETIVALGRIAHESTLRALGQKLSQHPFGHGACHQIGALRLFDSYHCSRYNTNTGVLTEAMFHDVFRAVKAVSTRKAGRAKAVSA